MNRSIIAAIVAVAGVLVLASTVLGTPTDKITLCHATASEGNPYVFTPVNISSVDEINNLDLNGHGDHSGDIIPPFTLPNGDVFPGQNWDEEGQAIWENGCRVPGTTTTTTMTTTTIPVSTTAVTVTTTIAPTTTGGVPSTSTTSSTTSVPGSSSTSAPTTSAPSTSASTSSSSVPTTSVTTTSSPTSTSPDTVPTRTLPHTE